MDYLNWVENNWGLLGKAMQGHTALYRLTGGRIGHRVPGAPPMLLLDHTGAKSGAKRTSPLVYVRDGGDLVLVASKGGYPASSRANGPIWPARSRFRTCCSSRIPRRSA